MHRRYFSSLRAFLLIRSATPRGPMAMMPRVVGVDRCDGGYRCCLVGEHAVAKVALSWWDPVG